MCTLSITAFHISRLTVEFGVLSERSRDQVTRLYTQCVSLVPNEQGMKYSS